MSTINYKTTLFKIGSWTILRLSKEASTKLPSRGMALVEGTINGSTFKAVLEPDGNGSHWLKIDGGLSKTIRANAGDTVTLSIEPSKDWPEPDVPIDIKKALASASQSNDLWQKITPMARWEWIRWIRATNRAETRARRIEVAMSKLKKGERRPCCFNSSMCTEPSVSKNGVLLEPAQLHAMR